MFRCDKCGQKSAKHVSPKKIVLETRPQTYVNRRKRDPRDRDWEEIVTYGWEIIREATVCAKPECSARAVDTTALTANIRQAHA